MAVEPTDLRTVEAWLGEDPDVDEVTAELRRVREIRRQIDTASGALAAYILDRLGLDEDDEPEELREAARF